MEVRARVNSTGFVKGEKTSYMTIDVIPVSIPSITFRLVFPPEKDGHFHELCNAGDMVTVSVSKP